MTTLNVNLSPALQQTLGQQGVYAYAVYFNSVTGGDPQGLALVNNGAIVSGGSEHLTLPSPYVGGKVYFVIQSVSAGSSDLFHIAADNTLSSGSITGESEINWQNAGSNDYRFDSFELILTPNAADVGNLTEVNGFGIPMAVVVDYNDKTSASRGYNVSGSSTFQLVSSGGAVIDAYDAGPLSGLDRMAASPTEVLGNNISGSFSSSDWNNYISSLESSSATISGGSHQIQIVGYYNGGKDADHVYHNGGFYSYRLTYDSGSDPFVLTPDATSQIQGTITITAADLANSIYATNGNATVSGLVDAQGQPTTLVMNTGWNNAWGAVLRDLSTGFTAGYYDGTGSSLNTSVTSPIDLNKTWNWDPTYAFGADHSSTSPDVQYDPYAKVFFDNTDSYGGGYSDNLMKAFTHQSVI
jgi:hypothetical protein